MKLSSEKVSEVVKDKDQDVTKQTSSKQSKKKKSTRKSPEKDSSKKSHKHKKSKKSVKEKKHKKDDKEKSEDEDKVRHKMSNKRNISPESIPISDGPNKSTHNRQSSKHKRNSKSNNSRETSVEILYEEKHEVVLLSDSEMKDDDRIMSKRLTAAVHDVDLKLTEKSNKNEIIVDNIKPNVSVSLPAESPALAGNLIQMNEIPILASIDITDVSSIPIPEITCKSLPMNIVEPDTNGHMPKKGMKLNLNISKKSSDLIISGVRVEPIRDASTETNVKVDSSDSVFGKRLPKTSDNSKAGDEQMKVGLKDKDDTEKSNSDEKTSLDVGRKSKSRSRSREKRPKSEERKNKSKDGKRNYRGRSKSKERSKKRSDRLRDGSKSRKRSRSKETSRKSKPSKLKESRDRSKSGSRSRRRSKKSKSKERSRRSRSGDGLKRSTNESKSRRSRSKDREKRSKRSKSKDNSRRSKSKDRSRRPRSRKSRDRSRTKRSGSGRSRDRSSDSKRNRKCSENEPSFKIDKVKLRQIAIKNALKNAALSACPQPVAKPEAKTEQKSGGKTLAEITEFIKKISEGSGEEIQGIIDNTNQLIDDDEMPFIPARTNKDMRTGPIMNQMTLQEKMTHIAEISSLFPVSSGNNHKDRLDGNDVGNVDATGIAPTNTSEEASNPDLNDKESEKPKASFTKDELLASKWVSAKEIPGQFTGSTNVQTLSQQELSGSYPIWAKKDALSSAPPLASGIGKLLLKKMGWKEGEGLGKNSEGMIAPLSIDIKTDRKGLVAPEEDPDRIKRLAMERALMHQAMLRQALVQQNMMRQSLMMRPNSMPFPQMSMPGGMFPLRMPSARPNFRPNPPCIPPCIPPAIPEVNPNNLPLVAPEISDSLVEKHPVSTLTEICSKRHWDPPEFILIEESGLAHSKMFKFKIILNGAEYISPAGFPQKKIAKMEAALVCLKHLGLHP